MILINKGRTKLLLIRQMWLRSPALLPDSNSIVFSSSRLQLWSSCRLVNRTVRQNLFITLVLFSIWILLLLWTSFGEGQLFVSLFSNDIFLRLLQFVLDAYLIWRRFFSPTTVWATKTSVNLVLNIGFLIYETLLLFLWVEFLYCLWEKNIFFHLLNFLQFFITGPLLFDFLLQLRHLFGHHFPFICLFHFARWLRSPTTCRCKPAIFVDGRSLCLLLQECSSLLRELSASMSRIASLRRLNLASLDFLIWQQILRVL